MNNIQLNANLHHEGHLDFLISQEVLAQDLHFHQFVSWPSDIIPWDEMDTDDGGRLIGIQHTPHSVRYVVLYESGLIAVNVNGGSADVWVHSSRVGWLDGLIEMARKLQPVHEAEDSMMVPINFWSYAEGHGPSFVRRDLDGLRWEDVDDNYSADEGLREQLDALLNKEWRPDTAGQLILWTGPPGTGKTTALRVLAHEWRDWCSCHYIADPEKFFGTHANYMIQVLLGGEDNPKEEGETEPRWKLLILEDAGEFLQPTARTDASSPALARFLNVVDGLIGRGLRVMVLVTTNEPVKELHEAVRRPGRCAADVRFDKLNTAEADAWVEEHGGEDQEEWSGGAATIADLYAHVHGKPTDRKRTPVGFVSK